MIRYNNISSYMRARTLCLVLRLVLHLVLHQHAEKPLFIGIYVLHLVLHLVLQLVLHLCFSVILHRVTFPVFTRFLRLFSCYKTTSGRTNRELSHCRCWCSSRP